MASDASMVTSARRPCCLLLQRRCQPLFPPRPAPPALAQPPTPKSLLAGLAASATVLLVLEGGPREEGGNVGLSS